MFYNIGPWVTFMVNAPCWADFNHARRNKTRVKPGNTKGGSITVPLTSCLTGLELAA
jgi:hypothetical protein